MGMEVEVERATGTHPRDARRVRAGLRAHDQPRHVRSQVEGNILQTLSRTLHEDIVFDRHRVTTSTGRAIRS